MKGWRSNIDPAVALEAAQAAQATANGAASAATAAQSDATQALEDASLEWLVVVFTVSNAGVVTPGTIQLPAPVTGTIETMAISCSGAPNVNLTCSATIGGVAVTGGSVQQLAADAAGTVRSTTATANHQVTELVTSVLLTLTAAGNTVTLRATVMVGFRRA